MLRAERGWAGRREDGAAGREGGLALQKWICPE